RSSSFVGKCRNTVPTPTPARRAISSVDASGPPSAKTAAAASRTSSRLRAASARRGGGGDVGGDFRAGGILTNGVVAPYGWIETELRLRYYPKERDPTMVEPIEVFNRVMGHLFACDAGAYADMFGKDAVVEWPFAPAGWPRRL